jgi:hypothetical protein
MKFPGRLLALAAVAAVGACAVPTPTGPGVVALPSRGKDLSIFQQEDAGCRSYASQQISAPQPVNNGYTPGTTAQQHYDIAYTQCMYSKGNSVHASAPLIGGAVFAYDYPYYGPIFGGGTVVAIGVGRSGSHGGWHGHGSRGGWGGHAHS